MAGLFLPKSLWSKSNTNRRPPEMSYRKENKTAFSNHAIIGFIYKRELGVGCRKRLKNKLNGCVMHNKLDTVSILSSDEMAMKHLY